MNTTPSGSTTKGGTPLSVLIIEDTPDDAELMLRELRRSGFEPTHECVETADKLKLAMTRQAWDVILCDYSLPNFSGGAALSMVRSRDADVPFIYVSGTIGEETAVAAMRAGAQDYVLKDNLKRLAPAVAREIKDAAVRRDRARAEAERRAVEARLGRVLTMAPDAIVAVNEDRRVAVFNRAAEILFGYRAEEIAGQPLDLLLPPDLAPPPHEALPDIDDASDGIRRLNERGDVFGRRKNGDTFPAEVSISKLVENGRPIFMTVVRDVSEWRRMTESLQQANQMLDTVIQSSPVAIVALDADRRVVVWNRGAERIFGYSAAEVIGGPYPVVPDGRRSEFDELFTRLSAGEIVRDVELSRRTKDGKIIEIRLSGTLRLDGAGKPCGALAVMEDVTDRKMIERQLEHARRLEAVGRLTGGVAHDFNNLLTVMMANLEMLQDRVEDDSDAEMMVGYAAAAAERGAALVRQLLAFSRKQPLDSTAFDLNGLVCQVLDFLGRTLGGEIEVQMSLADELWPVLADETQVESALINLAINARDAMPNGGCLTVETANVRLDEAYAAGEIDVTPGDYVVLAVSDTGTGIAPDVLARVFDPFFTTKEPGKGSGLGLSMVYGFAKQSGGHVKIYSEVGHGTTVRLFLPRAAVAAVKDARPARDDLEVAGRAATILVVEDDPDVRRSVVNQLARLGHRIHEAEDAAAALKFLKRGEHIDLLFTDIIMPGGMSGIDLAAEARKRRPDLKVLFTTGFAEAFSRNVAHVGPNGRLLTKPYGLRDLDKKVRETLQSEGRKR